MYPVDGVFFVNGVHWIPGSFATPLAFGKRDFTDQRWQSFVGKGALVFCSRSVIACTSVLRCCLCRNFFQPHHNKCAAILWQAFFYFFWPRRNTFVFQRVWVFWLCGVISGAPSRSVRDPNFELRAEHACPADICQGVAWARVRWPHFMHLRDACLRVSLSCLPQPAQASATVRTSRPRRRRIAVANSSLLPPRRPATPAATLRRPETKDWHEEPPYHNCDLSSK